MERAQAENGEAAPSGRTAWAAALALGVAAPVAAVPVLGGSWAAIGWGALAWVLGLVAKVPLAWAADAALSAAPPRVRAAGLGVASGAGELTVAALVFARWSAEARASWPEIVAFGVGAGSLELVLLLTAALFSRTPEDAAGQWLQAAASSWCVRNALAVERAAALAGHVGARGLVCVAVATGLPWPAAAALLSFSAVDALAAYGQLRRWNWFDPGTCRRFHALSAGISLVEVAALALAIPLLP
jgi:hypothetical protein